MACQAATVSGVASYQINGQQEKMLEDEQVISAEP